MGVNEVAVNPVSQRKKELVVAKQQVTLLLMKDISTLVVTNLHVCGMGERSGIY